MNSAVRVLLSVHLPAQTFAMAVAAAAAAACFWCTESCIILRHARKRNREDVTFKQEIVVLHLIRACLCEENVRETV